MQTLKNKKIQLFFLFLCLFVSITSCSDADKQNKSTVDMPFKTREEKINAIYKSFLYEETICPNFVKIIAEDTEFIVKFENFNYREKNSLNTMLLKSKVAKNDVVQYIIKHSQYFLIDVDCHGGAGSIDYVKNSCIFCSQTIKRLEELEEQGPSEKSWELRERFLNLLLKDFLEVGMPWNEGPRNFDFGYLKWEFDKTKKIYTDQAYSRRLNDWTNNVCLLLKEQTKHTMDGAAGLTKEQQIKTIEGWINLFCK